MAKSRKIIIGVICAFCALTLIIPCSSAGVAPVEENILIAVGNKSESIGVSYGQGNLNTVALNFGSEEYTALFGAKWTSYPDFTYTFNFKLGSGKDSIRKVFANGRYMNKDDINSLRGAGLGKFFAFLERTDNAFPATFKQTGTSSGNDYTVGNFTYTESKENSDYKTFVITAMTPNYIEPEEGFMQITVELLDVTVTFTGEIDSLVIGQFENTSKELGNISNKVDIVANDVQLAREDISNLKTFVETDGENTRTTIEATAKATQDAVDEASDRAHADADRAHEDSEKTQDAINNQPDNEYNKAQEKDKELENDVNDLSNSINMTETNDYFTETCQNFWGFLSSTKKCTSIKLPAGDVNLKVGGQSKKLHFWDEIYVHLDEWTVRNHWANRLIILVRYLCGFFLLSWALHFAYDVVSWFLGDGNKPISQIIFGFNPFDRGDD